MASRVPLIRTADAPDAVRDVYRRSYEANGGIGNLYRALANSPSVLPAWVELAWPLRSEMRVPRSLRELIILRVAAILDAPYVWAHHSVFALENGLSSEQVGRLDRPGDGDLFDEEQRAVIDAAEELTTSGTLSDDCFAALATRFDAEQIVELVTTISFYNCVARVTSALAIPLDKA
jgi:alkylhydroperoxidase family enzyme